MTSGKFNAFSRETDLHHLSHKGLNRELIPLWLKQSVDDLDSRIESSAYGETPDELFDDILELLEVGTDDVVLDLGAGGGGFLSGLLAKGASAFGFEQNPLLVRAGREFLRREGLESECLVEGDFFLRDWPRVTKAYSATAGFSEKTLTRLAKRIQSTDELTLVVTLGRPLNLVDSWKLRSQKDVRVRWNPGEASRTEKLSCWSRAVPRT